MTCLVDPVYEPLDQVNAMHGLVTYITTVMMPFCGVHPACIVSLDLPHKPKIRIFDSLRLPDRSQDSLSEAEVRSCRKMPEYAYVERMITKPSR